MRALSLLGLALLFAIRAWADPQAASAVYETAAVATPASRIDELTQTKWRQMGIEPARLCSDEVFVRRIYLDVIGTLPSAEEAKSFLDSKALNKRRELIDRLLAREEYADYWAMKWSDLLRVKAEFPINLWPNAVQAYHRWIRTSIAQNKPYDRFARELLTSSGSNFRVGPVNFYRAMQSKTPEGAARTIALTFMGARAEHWPKEKLDGMSGFFAQLSYKASGEWKEEIVFFEADKPAAEKIAYPGGLATKLPPDRDPREAFADWLITPENPWFTKNIANRVWCWLLGRGIIHEPDDLRNDNAPVNPELLAFLQRELIGARYDLKHLFRLILNSRTYQLSSIPRSTHPQAEAQFAYYPIRRLEAEVLVDALNQLTGTTESYASPIPEPFTFIPEDQRSIALADGSITSPFLELFGRSSRDTGMENERKSAISAAQRLHMLNSSHIQRKLEQGMRMQALLRSKDPLKEKANAIYLAILSRPPTDAELAAVQAYTNPMSGPSPANASLDLAWALINSAEFLHRH